MGSSHQRLLAVAALVFAMSAIVALVVLSPIVWRDGSNPGPAAEAVPARDEVAQVVAAPRPAPRAQEQDQPAVPRPAALQPATSEASPSGSPLAKQARPVQRPAAKEQPPVVFEKKGKGKAKGHERKAKGHEKKAKGNAKGHEKKALGSEKAGKHGHHAQGTPGKGHGKGKSKDRDRAPARARS